MTKLPRIVAPDERLLRSLEEFKELVTAMRAEMRGARETMAELRVAIDDARRANARAVIPAIEQAIADVAREFHVPPGAILGRTRDPVKTRAQMKTIRVLYQLGFSQWAICKALQKSHFTVKKALQQESE